MLNIALTRRQNRRGALLKVAAVHRTSPHNTILGFSLRRHHQQNQRLLNIALVHQKRQKTRRFKGIYAVGIGDFDVVVHIGRRLVPMCELAESMRISHGENENYRCEFTIRKNRFHAAKKNIYPHAWNTQSITVTLQSETDAVVVYRGFVDGIDVNVNKGTLTVKCSDRRERMINNLSWASIRQIGYTAKAVHGEFANKLDELQKRLETIPASFEFDLNGTGYINSWLPSSAPHLVLNPCMIYQREPTVRLAEARSVVNEVEIDFSFSYTRLLQRNITYGLDVGLTVCDFYRYGKLPTVEAIAAAASQTGWTLGRFSFEREPTSGWVHCGGTRPVGWLRPHDSSSVLRGDFELIKRWTQPVREIYRLTLQNRFSILRYEKGSEKLAYQLQVDAPNGWENPPQRDLDYELLPLTVVSVSNNQVGTSLPTWRNRVLNIAPNGDYFALADNQAAGLQEAITTAMHIGRTKILASHRQNTVDVQTKWLPRVSLRQTHRIEHSNIQVTAKVSRFEHEFHFKNGRGQSSIQYRFFQSGGSALSGFFDSGFSMPSRPQFDFAPRSARFLLGRVELDVGTEVRNHWGMVYRKLPQIDLRVQLFEPVVFRVRAPEIEQQSTDAIEKTVQRDYSVAIPDNPLEIWL